MLGDDRVLVSPSSPCSDEKEQEGGYMSCLICAGQAESVTCIQGWEERQCSQCGHYRMAQALILLMMDEGQIFDISLMRQWLTARRDMEAVPLIDHRQAIWVR